MKAKDYYIKFINENQDQTPNWRVRDALKQMFFEVDEIIKARNAKQDAAMIAIFNEMEIKSHKFIALVNETEPYKTKEPIRRDAFRLFVAWRSEELAAMIWGKEIAAELKKHIESQS